jgi:hypothetical protein
LVHEALAAEVDRENDGFLVVQLDKEFLKEGASNTLLTAMQHNVECQEQSGTCQEQI